MSQRRACGLIGISESSYRYRSIKLVVPELKELLLRLAAERPNAFVESFNGRFRDECLNEHWFEGLHEAREVIEQWRQDYNQLRPHSSLGDLTPEGYAARLVSSQAPAAPSSPPALVNENGPALRL